MGEGPQWLSLRDTALVFPFLPLRSFFPPLPFPRGLVQSGGLLPRTRTGACRRGLEGREGFLRWEGVGHGPRNRLYLKAMPDTSGSRHFYPAGEGGSWAGSPR